MNDKEWLASHKGLLKNLGKLNMQRKELNKEIKEVKKNLNILDELLLK